MDPASKPAAFRRSHLYRRLKQRLSKWEDDLEPRSRRRPGWLRARREIFGELSRRPDQFIDPCDYLKGALEHPKRVPRMLEGCAHGDLHGRNVLVAIVQGAATSPVVFDYEDMGRKNEVGWDFVKMETELKARAAPLVFGGSETVLVDKLLGFEIYLAEQ